MALPKIPAGSQTEARLVIRRTLQAPREKVFAAWTEEEALKQWWGPEGMTCHGAECDPRVGGRYRIEIRGGKGEVYAAYGEFKLVEPPEKLVYTWRWEQWTKEMPETTVTVEFIDKGGATELILTHEGFADAETRDDHNGGWNSALDCLTGYLNG